MLHYNEYYNRMAAIEKFLNAAADNAQINVSGMNDREAAIYKIGKYFQNLATATMPSFFIEKCTFPISILVHIVRAAGGSFNFSLIKPEEVDSDAELSELWSNDFIDYTRMSATAMFGAATSVVGTEYLSDFNQTDIVDWCSCQAEHLAKYCIAHDFDITRVIDMV